MPPKSEDKHVSLEELKVALTVVKGQLEFLGISKDFKNLPEDEQRKVLEMKRRLLESLKIVKEALRRQIIALEIQLYDFHQLEAWFKRLGVRKTRKRSDAGQPRDHKG